MTVRLRQLGRELRDSRKQAGFTLEQAAERLECSKSRLIYIEQGKGTRPSLEFVRALLDLYAVDAKRRKGLLDFTRQSRTKGWWSAYSDIFPADYPSFEDAATSIRTYEVLLMPGLLQTAEYAKALARASLHPQPEDVIERRIEARQARQKILDRDDPPKLWAIIDEAAIERSVGGMDVMEAQIRHLVDVSAKPNVTIQILPAEAGAYAAMTSGAFVLLDYDEQVPLVYLEGVISSLYMEEPGEWAAYNLLFDQVGALALTPEKSMDYLEARYNPTAKEGEHGSKH